MINQFKEFYKLSNSNFSDLWKNAIIIFDANVLLNFYRYSDTTVDEFKKIFEALKDRLWIPHQIGKEFHEERLNVIQQQAKVYINSLNHIKELEKDFSNENRNPFLSDSLLKEFKKVLGKVYEELEVKNNKYEAKLLDDDILPYISSIFQNKVGDEFSEEELENIYQLGQKRYDAKIPPGYEDKNKNDRNQFGDLIIWLQILKEAKLIKKPVIYITDDRKEDWWIIRSGKLLGPRPELRKEFSEQVNEIYYQYQPFQFLEFSKLNLKILINDNVIQEVKDLKPLTIDIKTTDERNDILISILLEPTSTRSKIEAFVRLLESSGYEVHLQKQDNNKYKIFIPVPNILDLPRRIKTRFLDQAADYNLKLLEFKPEIG